MSTYQIEVQSKIPPTVVIGEEHYLDILLHEIRPAEFNTFEPFFDQGEVFSGPRIVAFNIETLNQHNQLIPLEHQLVEFTPKPPPFHVKSGTGIYVGIRFLRYFGDQMYQFRITPLNCHDIQPVITPPISMHLPQTIPTSIPNPAIRQQWYEICVKIEPPSSSVNQLPEVICHVELLLASNYRPVAMETKQFRTFKIEPPYLKINHLGSGMCRIYFNTLSYYYHDDSFLLKFIPKTHAHIPPFFSSPFRIISNQTKKRRQNQELEGEWESLNIPTAPQFTSPPRAPPSGSGSGGGWGGPPPGVDQETKQTLSEILLICRQIRAVLLPQGDSSPDLVFIPDQDQDQSMEQTSQQQQGQRQGKGGDIIEELEN